MARDRKNPATKRGVNGLAHHIKIISVQPKVNGYQAQDIDIQPDKCAQNALCSGIEFKREQVMNRHNNQTTMNNPAFKEPITGLATVWIRRDYRLQCAR